MVLLRKIADAVRSYRRIYCCRSAPRARWVFSGKDRGLDPLLQSDSDEQPVVPVKTGTQPAIEHSDSIAPARRSYTN
jgi:hypothetical protein